MLSISLHSQVIAMVLLIFSQISLLGGSPLEPHQLPAQMVAATARQARRRLQRCFTQLRVHKQLLRPAAQPTYL